MENDSIPQLSGQIAKDIRQGYIGGAVDVYIPRPPKGTKLFVYDVNSLYPFTMDKWDMPVGKPILFEGNIWDIDSEAFGFFYCNIQTPNNLKHPIILTHVETEAGIRSVAPLGSWSGILFSEEIINAIKYGYKFEILWGYKFERKNIFKEYVNTLYQLRSQYPKSHPLNLIAKLLLNSLYGKFGMTDQFPIIKIIDAKDIEQFIDNLAGDNIKIVPLGNKYMVIYSSTQKNIDTMLDGYKETHNVSIAIAAAITAYARIHMTQFKNNPDFNLYYSDTDSSYIDKKLPDHMVSSTILGKMKLENILEDAIFLAPKVYCLKTEDDKVIYKVKGLSHDINLTMKDFEQLLLKDSWIEKTQTKWRRNLSEGHISILNEIYTLKVTDNKRKLIYDENNKLVETESYIINSKKEIINK